MDTRNMGWELPAEEKGGDALDAQREYGERRDHLVSRLLQERRKPRLLVAPQGFGKTMLAREYAVRMFSNKVVEWVDASRPEFLESIDAGALQAARDAEKADLVVVDDVPALSSARADVFADYAERVVYNGSELIVTMEPERDCLSTRLQDAVRLGAQDLMVTEQECLAAAQGGGQLQKTRASQEWQRAAMRPLGHVPSVYWGKAKEALAQCLGSFFARLEDRQIAECATALFLLGSGQLADLGAMGVECTLAVESALRNEYPFFGLADASQTFSTAFADFAVLRRAVSKCRYGTELLVGPLALPQRAVRLLLDRACFDRAGGVLSCFCDDACCSSWLKERGWSLLDGGQLALVEELIGRCPDGVLEADGVLAAQYAWLCGLKGDFRESSYFAQRVLRLPAGQDGMQEQADTTSMAAYLALLAFGSSGPLIYSKGSYAAEIAETSPGGFLAAVVDACTPVELGRALCMEGTEQAFALERERSTAQPERVEALRALAVEASERFPDTLEFRLVLHFMSFVDSTELRACVQELGCGTVLQARRKGLGTISGALVVRDLWNGGFFGPLGRMGDKRDAKLLESAASILRRMGKAMGYDEVRIPWELGSRLRPSTTAQVQPEVQVKESLEIPKLSVRMFGGFEVKVGDRVVPDTVWRKKTRVLFATLALNQGKDIARADLLRQLWPNAGRPRALNNYYTLWANMCDAIGSDRYFERNGEFCRVNPRLVISDVAEFEQLSRNLLVEHGDTQMLLDMYARIESVYKGGLLPSETSYEHINRSRLRYKAMFVDSMVAATTRAIEVRDARVALWFARKGMEAEREREDVYHALIRAQIAAGQRCSAIKTYFKCKQFLRDELGLDPSLELQELYDQLITVDPSLMSLTAESFRI